MNIKLLCSIFMIYCSIADAVGWTNWAGNQMCYPTNLVSPSSLEELQQIIKQASKEKKQVRAVGSGHSWTDILCSDGFMIKTDNFNKVLSIDKTTKQIRVEAGIKLKDLARILASNNLALPNQPAVLEQSIAGAISTATHGTGHTGTMADFIVKIELLAADGTLYELSQDNHPDYFAAARVSIGSLGIIYAVTIQCVSLFKLKHQHYQTSWDVIKNDYQKLNQENDFFSFLYLVQDDFVAVDIWNRTKEPLSENFWFTTKNMVRTMYNTSIDTLKYYLPQYISDSAKLALEPVTVAYSYKALSGEPSPFYLEEEIAIKQELLPEAVEKIAKLIRAYKQKGILIYGILCRFVKADTMSYLSPAAGQEVVFLSVTMPYKKENDFYKDYYELMLEYNGRPHWGKINYLTAVDAKKVYGNNFEHFIEVRKKLDPNGMFSNSFTKRLFGW